MYILSQQSRSIPVKIELRNTCERSRSFGGKFEKKRSSYSSIYSYGTNRSPALYFDCIAIRATPRTANLFSSRNDCAFVRRFWFTLIDSDRYCGRANDNYDEIRSTCRCIRVAVTGGQFTRKKWIRFTAILPRCWQWTKRVYYALWRMLIKRITNIYVARWIVPAQNLKDPRYSILFPHVAPADSFN